MNRTGSQACTAVWHPSSLDVDVLFRRYGQRVGEGVLWLGHCVYAGQADNVRYQDSGRVPLKAEYLRSVLGRHSVDAVRQAAVEVRYVDRDPSYRTGDRSQTYWVLPPYDQSLLVRREIANFRLRHAIRTWLECRRRTMWQRILRNETPVDALVCRHLWENLQRVSIDFGKGVNDAAHPAQQIAAERIREGDFWFIVDDHGRIHTNLTNAAKALRQHLSVDGERLANIDISESQPLFLGMEVAKGSVQGKGGGARRKREGGGDDDGSHSLSHMMDNTMMDTRPQPAGETVDAALGVGIPSAGRLPADLRHYLDLCQSRGLYQAVADRLGKPREEVKQRIMVVFYGKPSLRTPVSKVLDELFPSMMHALRSAKQEDHRRLAHHAQRLESGFMFGRVVPRIMELRPDLFIATIHDSILTTAKDAKFVRKMMLAEFARLGLKPQVRVEPC